MSKRTIEVDKRDFVIVFEDKNTKILGAETTDSTYFGQFLGALVAKRIQQISENETALKEFMENVSKELAEDFTKWKAEKAKETEA